MSEEGKQRDLIDINIYKSIACTKEVCFGHQPSAQSTRPRVSCPQPSHRAYATPPASPQHTAHIKYQAETFDPHAVPAIPYLLSINLGPLISPNTVLPAGTINRLSSLTCHADCACRSIPKIGKATSEKVQKAQPFDMGGHAI